MSGVPHSIRRKIAPDQILLQREFHNNEVTIDE